MIIDKLHKFYTALAFFFIGITLPLVANEQVGLQKDYFQANPIIAEIDGEIIRFEDLRDKAAQDAAQALYVQLARLLPNLVLNDKEFTTYYTKSL